MLREAALPGAVGAILARADRDPCPVAGLDARLFDLFGVLSSPDGDLPVAAVTRLADMGMVDREWWVRADPVYLEPRRDGLVLHTGLDLSKDEADQLIAELEEALAADGWLIKAPNPNRWYLKPVRAAQLTTTPLAAVIGQNVDSFLPKGPDAPVWHTRLNEFQILMHTSSVNVARQSQGRLPANSVWFWGGGRLPAAGSTRYTQAWSDEPLALGLASLASLPSAPIPADARQWFESAGTGDHLVVLDSVAAAAQRGDTQGWSEALKKLAVDWIEPLATYVHARALADLTLLADIGPVFHYRRAHRWRFWKRLPALAGLRGTA